MSDGDAILDLLLATAPVIALAVSFVALYQSWRARRYEDRGFLFKEVYTPLHSSLTDDLQLLVSLERRGSVEWLRGRELIERMKRDGTWHRVASRIRRRLEWLYMLDGGQLNSLLDRLEDLTATITAEIERVLTPLVNRFEDLDHYPQNKYQSIQQGTMLLPIDFLRGVPRDAILAEVSQARCVGLANRDQRVDDGVLGSRDNSAYWAGGRFTTGLPGGCHDYLHFDESGRRETKVALHELRWLDSAPTDFLTDLDQLIERLPNVRDWKNQRRQLISSIEETLTQVRAKIREPS